VIARLKSSHPLQRFVQVLLVLWVITLIAGWIERDLLHWPPGSWYPLFPWEARYTDFTIFQQRFSHFHDRDFFALAGFPFTYPAPVALVFEGFYLFGSHSLGAFLFFCFLVVGIAGVLLGRAMNRRSLKLEQAFGFLALSLFLSYPFWFLVDRANIEIVNWLLVALGVTAYWNKRWYLAATFFGIAISFKIFPFVFLGLLFSSRKYLAILWGVMVAAAATLASTWIMGPTYQIASKGIAQGLEYFRLHYALEVHGLEIGFDHSIFAIVKELTFHHKIVQEVYYLPWLNGYMVVAALAGIILFFWKIRKLPRANQILALTVASVLLPPVSSDYTLVHLYIPWAVLVLLSISIPDGQRIPGLTLSFVCLAFLMAPESYLVLHGFKVAGQLKAVVLLILFVISIYYPFQEQVPDGDRQQLACSAA
jgi:hypothetical protein